MQPLSPATPSFRPPPPGHPRSHLLEPGSRRSPSASPDIRPHPLVRRPILLAVGTGVLFLFLFLSALTHSIQGAEPSSGTLTLDSEAAVKLALANNPELRLAALEIARAQTRLRWSSRLPNPEFEISAHSDQFGQNHNEGSIEAALSQRFPLTNRLHKEKTLRRAHLEAAWNEYHFRQLQLAYEVDQNVIALAVLQRSLNLSHELLQSNAQVAAFLGDRAQAGEVSPLDVTQTALTSRLLQQALGSENLIAIETQSRLLQLLGLPADTTLTISQPLSLPPTPPADDFDLPAVLERRPDYAGILTQSELGQAQLALARAQRWDDVSVKLFLTRERAEDAPDGLENNTFAGIGLSIPLPLRNRNQLAIEESHLDIEHAARALEAMRFAIASELHSAVEARATAYDLALQAGGETLTLAQKNFADFQAAQQSGQANLTQVQQAQSQLIQLQTAALELLKAYHLADAQVRFLSADWVSLDAFRIPSSPLHPPAK